MDVGWLRRTRIGGDWIDGTGDVPLYEDGQAYVVEFLDVDNATVKRTQTVTTNSIVYTAAMQTANFGSAQSTIRVNVYQLSAQVGKGFGANAVIDHSSTLPPTDPAQAMALSEIESAGFSINGT